MRRSRLRHADAFDQCPDLGRRRRGALSPEPANAVLIEEFLNRDEDEVTCKCLGYQDTVEWIAKGTLQCAGAGCVFHGDWQPFKVLIGYVAGNVLGEPLRVRESTRPVFSGDFPR